MSADWRRAELADAVALRDLEREANLVGLAHVFPPETYPFPNQGVLDRWTETLADPAVSVELLADPHPVALVAWDVGGRVRHLAVAPDRWGSGLARQAVARAVSAMAAGVTPRLWVLRANDRARGVYAHLGWEPTGRQQPAEWPPYPVELELQLASDLRESAGGR